MKQAGTIIGLLICILFAVLWLRAETKPTEVREIIRDVPREVIRNVTNEILAPAQMSAEETNLITIGLEYYRAKPLTNMDGALFGISSFSVHVEVDEAVEPLLSQQRVQNRFELVLRRNNIVINEKSPARLQIELMGLWSPRKELLFYYSSLHVHRSAVIESGDEMRSLRPVVWEDERFGGAGSDGIEKLLLESIDSLAEHLANVYLAANPPKSK
jgi:hypothetical protein